MQLCGERRGALIQVHPTAWLWGRQNRGVIVNTINWKIEGMRCGACARMIQARLVREPGVMQAEVAYPAGTARILVESPAADLDPITALLEQAGYRIETRQSC